MGGIFISYRRNDSAPYARLLSEELAERFGTASIFRDIDTIRPGTNFAEAIREAVASCDALIVVIGAEWLTISDGEGRRRLDDPEDYVRLEVVAGLQRDDVLVVPVLVEGARMPSKEQLPLTLAPLSEQMALELTDAGWGYQIERLVDVLSTVVEPAGPPVQSAAPARHQHRAVAAAAVAILAIVAIVLLLRPGPDPEAPTPTGPASSTVGATSAQTPTSAGPLVLDVKAGSGFTVKVPDSWLKSEAPTAEPGAGPAEIWTDPDDPNRRLRVIGSRCAPCATTPEGAPDVKRLIPQPNVRSAVKTSKFATYEAYEAGNPLRINGLVRIYEASSVVVGYYRVDLWLPDEMKATGTLILNSFRGSI